MKALTSSTPASMSAVRSPVSGTWIGSWTTALKRAPWAALHRHRLQHRAETERQAGRPGRRPHRVAEEQAFDAAIELLVVHQRHGLALLHAFQQLARAVAALGGEQPHAVAEAAGLDAFVHIRIVGRAIGHLADDPGIHDRRRHHLPVRQVSRKRRPPASCRRRSGTGAPD